MAAGLFASLFAASSSGSTSEVPARKRSRSQSVSDPDETDDELELQRPITTQHDVDMADAEAGESKSTISPIDPVSLKEAQEVADVDMQLSSPPSSPPTAPATPQDASIPPASLHSVKMESSSSNPGRHLSSSSPLSTPASDREPATGKPEPSSAPAVQRASRRRTMPARLSQVSSLLAGSSLEEELLLLDTPSSPSGSSFQQNTKANLNGAGPPGSKARHATNSSTQTTPLPSSYFSSSSVVVLSSDQSLLKRAVFPNAPSSSSNGQSSDIKVKAEAEESALSPSSHRSSASTLVKLGPSLVSTLAIKRQQLIETPDFKQRDDTLYMPKTRGLRSEAAEDTSDAAYERRHRKPEAAEKRQRKAEVDRLTRDRQKLLARIDQIKTVEARMLQPIVIARDQVRAEADGQNDDSKAEVKPLSERIEDVRKELLDDAYETLKRYDLLLSISNDAKQASPWPSTLAGKIESASAAVTDDAARSQSPRLKIRIKGGKATWETAESASPTARQSPVLNAKSDLSRRISARQPKQRVESLPTPLTAAAVEAVEDNRRQRRRLSSAYTEETSPARRKASAAHADKTSPTRTRSNNESLSPERRIRRRGSPEVGGTYKGKFISKEHEDDDSSPRTNGRPKRAAAAAAALASARQRRIAERSFSDFDYDDEEGEVDSAIDEAESPSHSYASGLSTRRASHSLRRSPLKTRDQRSPSTSSTTSSISSMASSLGYMFPTLPDTGSLKVSQSLAEIHAADPEATSRSVLADEGARKKLKLALSSSPSSAAKLDGEKKKALSEALEMDVEQETSGDGGKGKALGGALTESEAESILAAFLGTTPIGKSAKAPAAPTQSPAPTSKVSSGATTAAKSAAAASSPAATQSNNATPSKRRSSRRDTTLSFGEKLPDLLTKTAPFDFSVMGYFQSIDKPRRADEGEDDGRS